MRNERAILLAIVAVALAARLLYFTVALGGQVPLAEDARFYVAVATSVLEGHGYAIDGRPTAADPPGYPIFLVAVFAATGRSEVAIVVAQMIVGALTAGLTFRIARRVAPVVWAAAAGLAMALHADVLLWTNYLITDTLAVFVLCGSLLLALRANERRDDLGALGSAAALTLGALVRPLYAAYLVGVLGWLVALSGARARRAVLLAFVCAVVLLPWAVRNAVTLGAPYPLSSKSGTAVLWSVSWTEGLMSVDPPPEARELGEVALDAYLRERSLRWIAEHPAEFAWLALRKAADNWKPTQGRFSPAHQAVDIAEWLLVAIGLALFARSARRLPDGRAAALLVTVLVSGTVAIALTTPDGEFRYRLPMLPAAFALAASGYASLRRTNATSA